MTENPLTHAGILGGFCLGFGFLLAVTYWLTADAIQQRALDDKLVSLGQVIPAALYDNNPIADAVSVPGRDSKAVLVYRAARNHRVVAVAYEISGNGYAGEIRLMLGVDAEGINPQTVCQSFCQGNVEDAINV